MEKEIYLGLYLGGIKKDKSSLLVLESFKGQNKLVISNIESKFKNAKVESYPDEILKKQIKHYKNVKYIGASFPLTPPPCLPCKLKCPGVSKCQVTEVKWMVREYKKASKLTQASSKDRGIPSPYSERGLDYFIANLLEEKFPLEPAFGPTRSAFYARGQFLMKGLKDFSFVEVSSRASLWRLGLKYGIRKSVLRNFYRSEKSEEHREVFLDKLEKDFFLYAEDKELLIGNKFIFEALICALSAYSYSKKEVETVPPQIAHSNNKFALPEQI
jgi:hypothetical protein